MDWWCVFKGKRKRNVLNDDDRTNIMIKRVHSNDSQLYTAPQHTDAEY